MNDTATLEPAAVTTPELISNIFNERGTCVDPETVNVLMPPGCVCRLYLAVAPDGTWRAGCDCGGPGAETPLASMARLDVDRPNFGDRKDALCAALQEAVAHFAKIKKAKKAVKALEVFYEANCGLLEVAPVASAATGLPSDAKALEGGPANGSTSSPQASSPDGPDAAPARGEYCEIPVAAVSPNPANSRKCFDPDELDALAESIRREGLLQPIAVRELPCGEIPAIADAVPPAARYEIILGQRRWRAHGILNAATIQAKVYRGLDSGRAKVLALIENLQRVNLNAIEEAEGYADLAAEGLTQDAIAAKVGRSRPAVANALRLLKLPSDVLTLIRIGKLTSAHGLALARFDGFPEHQGFIASRAVKDKVPAGELEKGVPYTYEMRDKGMVTVIVSWQTEFHVTDKLKKHPAYFAESESNWVCFDPAHWAAECEERKRQSDLRAEAEQRRREEELAKAVKSKKKELALADMKQEDFRQLGEEQLLALVPEGKKTAAKDFDGSRTTIVTDVDLADRLKAAMARAIKKDRKAKVPDLEAKARKKIAGLKKVGPREMAWLVYLIATFEGREMRVELSAEAADRAGVKLPKVLKDLGDTDNWAGVDFAELQKVKRSIYDAYAGMEAHELVKVLMEDALEYVLAEVIEHGPECIAAQMLRWWLASDTLWLLEETEEGKTELVDQVKNAPWYAQAVGLGPRVGDIVEWPGNGRIQRGVVLSVAEFEKRSTEKWDKSKSDCTPVHETSSLDFPGMPADRPLITAGLTIVDDEKEEP
jgi:ParB family transcriptional regulator, chromosome partitioning protein